MPTVLTRCLMKVRLTQDRCSRHHVVGARPGGLPASGYRERSLVRTPNPHPGDPGSSLLEGATQGELWGLSLGSRLPLGIGQVSDRPAGCPWL